MKKIQGLLYYLIIIACLFSCTTKQNVKEQNTLFSLLDPKQTGIDFINQLTDGPDANIFLFRNYYNGGGVAIGDVNNDGLNDIFLTSNQGDNKLYLNKGNWQFEDITDKAGVKRSKYWSTGVTMVDINADGWLDIYVCNSGDVKGNGRGNELFINQENGTFLESAKAYNLVDNGLSTHAAFFDYDLDGDLDCYVLNNSFRSNESFDFRKHLSDNTDSLGGDRLYRNDNMHFTDVTDAAGIHSSDIGYGLGVSVTDLNQDGYPDIYVANDFFEKDYLFINQRNGTFKEDIESSLGHLSLSSMGADIADINNDGHYDIFSTEMLPEDDRRYKLITSFETWNVFKMKQSAGFHNQYMQNCLQLNNGDGSFSELAWYAGVAATDWSWGSLLFDMDNDGWKDIFVCNGIAKDLTNQDYIDFLSTEDNLRKITHSGTFDYKEFTSKMSSSPLPNYAFSNNRNMTFTNRAADFGLDQPSFSHGAAYGDLDNDGDNDLVVNNVNKPLFIYKSNAAASGNHSVRLQLKGDTLNPFAIGSTVRAFMGETSLTYYHHNGHGFQSSISPNMLIIGTGTQKHIDSIQVIWPDGIFSTYKDLASDWEYTFHYTQGQVRYDFSGKSDRPEWEEVSKQMFDSVPKHIEDVFIDYDRERLMLQTASTANPYMAAGDINNDGLTDFYYSSSKGYSPAIYVQRPNGAFREYIPDDFKKYQLVEKAGAAFGDFDKDGDQDLIMAHGGNEEKQGSPILYPLYYENDGKGNLSINHEKHIAVSVNASIVRAHDYDKDGDPDLFIGGRIIPGVYGSTPPSFLLTNDGTGHFTDKTVSVFGNTPPGMITDAKWVDVDKNGFDDLILAGHWMGILIYKNDKGIFTPDPALEKYKGLWNCLEIADINNDGNPDIIAGNLGLNTKLRANFIEPMKLYIKDFDENGTKESILSLFKTDHKPYVFHQRRDLTDQMPSFKKSFLKYADYAGKEFSEIFPSPALAEAEVHEVSFLETAVFINKGNSQFEIRPLPFPAQVSSVHTILYNSDSREMILAGNFTDFKPEIGSLDGNYGQVFQSWNDQFIYKPVTQTGLKLNGQIRSSLVIRNKKGGTYFLFGRNNASLLAYHAAGSELSPVGVRRPAIHRY
jgi:enediyne biosynthesis protein E4